MRLAVAVSLALGLVVLGCNTPSVPIPPPATSRIEFELEPDVGQARFRYLATPEYGGAIVYVFNRDQGRGIIETAGDDGAVGPTAPFPGVEGDDIVISFQVDDDIQSICVTLRAGRSSDALRCGL
jgi:hypothetical protein